MSGIVFSKESSRVEATLDCRLFAVPGRAHYIPRLGFSLQDALMDGRTPHVRPVSTQHPSPSIWTPRGGQGEGGSVKRVSHLEESLGGKHFVGLPVVVAVKPVKLEVMYLYF